MRDGKLRWAALPYMRNDAILNLIEMAHDAANDEKPEVVCVEATIFENPYMPEESRAEIIKGWKKDTAQADMLVAGLTDLAQSHAPPFTVFGASPDGEWGCWFCVGSYQEAIYDGDVALCIDGDVEAVALANPDADYVSLVSDHGNVELFCAGTLREEGSQAASIYGVV